MLTRFLSETIFGQLVGNFIGIIQAFINKDKPIWISKFYFQYRKFKEYSFVLTWAFLAFIIGSGLLRPSFGSRFGLISSFFFVTGLLILLQMLHYFDKLYVYSDRFEIRFFFYSYFVIPFDKVQLVLRTKESQSYTQIIYDHPIYGLASLGGKDTKWKIPVNKIFLNPNIQISKDKLHPNIFTSFPEVKDLLPETPIVYEKREWGRISIIEKTASILILFLNPYSVLIFSTVFFGIHFISIPFLILFEFSRVYSQLIFRYFASKYKLKSLQGV